MSRKINMPRQIRLSKKKHGEMPFFSYRRIYRQRKEMQLGRDTSMPRHSQLKKLPQRPMHMQSAAPGARQSVTALKNCPICAPRHRLL